MSLKITAEEWKEWEAHPVTKVFREYLEGRQKSLQDQWAVGMFQSEEPVSTQSANQNALSEMNVTREILELEFSQVEGVLRNE